MVLDNWQHVFLAGALGPVLVEIVKLSQMREKTRIPRLYRRWSYWLLTIPLIAVGGVAAVAHGTEKVSLWTALQLGASAPLLFAALASGRGRDASRDLIASSHPPSGWDLLRW